MTDTSPNTVTLVFMGKTGAGKSTIANAILHGCRWKSIPETFNVSGSVNACTNETSFRDGIFLGGDLGDGQFVRIIDTPGLAEGEAAD
jgi:Predicted GTPase